MRIAVLSGKGGAGKTFVSVNLAKAAKRSVYIDCDVEEPNGHLFFRPTDITTTPVNVQLPQFHESCIGCRKCVNFCQFHALIYIKNQPKLFPEVCHSCGGCQLVCENHAITEISHPVGHIEDGFHEDVHVVTGMLDIGEVSGNAIIQQELKQFGNTDLPTIIDCPPGSSCPVMESITDVDYCILVVEPTAFGFHNFLMVYELATLLHKPCGIIINKEEATYEPLETFCREHTLPILLRLPYDKNLAAQISSGEIACEKDDTLRKQFESVLAQIGGMA